MFGRKKVTTPNATSAGDLPTDQPTYANQPRGAQAQGAFPDAAQTGTGPRSSELLWNTLDKCPVMPAVLVCIDTEGRP